MTLSDYCDAIQSNRFTLFYQSMLLLIMIVILVNNSLRVSSHEQIHCHKPVFIKMLSRHYIHNILKQRISFTVTTITSICVSREILETFQHYQLYSLDSFNSITQNLACIISRRAHTDLNIQPNSIASDCIFLTTLHFHSKQTTGM